MIDIINENNRAYLCKLVLDELDTISNISSNESLEFSCINQDRNVIRCEEKNFNIVFNLDCEDPNRSIISYGNILSNNYTKPSDFFNKISKLDEINDIFRHLWYDFNSAVDNVKEEY